MIYALAITPDGARAYATNDAANTVWAIDLTTNTVIGDPIAVGSRPISIAITPDGGHAYVTNQASNNVSVLDLFTNTVIGDPIAVGSLPVTIAITPDGTRAYVTNAADHSVSVIDLATNAVIGAPIIVPGQPYGVAITTRPLTLSDQIRHLKPAVEGLLAAGSLNRDQAKALTTTLEQAFRRIAAGRTIGAIEELTAFVGQVNHLLTVEILTLAEGQPLIDGANAVIAGVERVLEACTPDSASAVLQWRSPFVGRQQYKPLGRLTMKDSFTGRLRWYRRVQAVIVGLSALAAVRCTDLTQSTVGFSDSPTAQLVKGEHGPIKLSRNPVSAAFDVSEGGVAVGIVSRDLYQSVAVQWTRAGEETLLQGGNGATPLGINESGQIAGYSAGFRATVWSALGVPLDINPSGGASFARSINEAGQVVGWGYDNPGGSGLPRPFVWSRESGMRDLVLLPGGTYGVADDINDLGQVVGCSLDDVNAHLVMWNTDETIVDLGIGYCAAAVNNHGTIVGNGATGGGAFRWTASEGLVLLDSVYGSLRVADVNDREEIVGSVYVSGPRELEHYGFRWTQDEGVVVLSSGEGIAYGINACGSVVGASFRQGGALLWPLGTCKGTRRD